MKHLLFMGLFLPLVATSQTLENLKAVSEGNKVVVSYDLVDVPAGGTFDVMLYASNNNFNTALQLVSGDVGRGIREGKDKRIEWDARGELGNFKGALSFEVRAQEIVVFSLSNTIKSIKRGKRVELDWLGGNKTQDVKIELLKSGIVTKVLGEGPNNGSYLWSVSSHEKAGNDYQIRLVNGHESVVSEPFSIKHKIPTLLKIAPLALIALAVVPSSSPSAEESRNSSLVSVSASK